MTPNIEIETESDAVALEIGYAIVGRAQVIHDNPVDMYEDVALELREIGQTIIAQYEGQG